MTDPSSSPATADARAAATDEVAPRATASPAGDGSSANDPETGPAATAPDDRVVEENPPAAAPPGTATPEPATPEPATPEPAEPDTTTPEPTAAAESAESPEPDTTALETPAPETAAPEPADPEPAGRESAPPPHDRDTLTAAPVRGSGADTPVAVSSPRTEHVTNGHRATHRAPDPLPAPDPRGTVTLSRRRRLVVRLAVGALVLVLAAVSTLAVHLYRTTTAWEQRAQEYQAASSSLGEQLAVSRAEVTGLQSELEGVRGQLANASTRIDELANEKAQVTDDREAQRQLVDYQERVTEAAGKVALALDQCVQGQDQLITYLEAQAAAAEADTPPPYDAAELEQYRTDVETLCRTASEANVSLQDELDR